MSKLERNPVRGHFEMAMATCQLGVIYLAQGQPLKAKEFLKEFVGN
jgi:Tfp pilus assembly protein PilF